MIPSPHRLIKAFLRQPVDRTPVWLMRQAGRYLPEYRKQREKAKDFMTLCKTPELACEVSLQPIQRFNLDGVIIFSDILTIPDAMGLGLHFVEQEGPQFSNPIKTEKDIQQLPLIDPETELRYVMDTIRLVKSSLKNSLPVLGFSGSPWTLAAYMLEGKSSDNFHLAKKMMYQHPELLEQLLNKLVVAVTAYLKAQIAAGVDAVMIFDTWGGLLTQESFEKFSLTPLSQIISSLKSLVPVILFSKYAGQHIEKMAAIGCQVIGIDWTTPLGIARKKVGDRVALQGNLDPALLFTSPECIEKHVKNLLEEYGHHPGHIFNLGHGIPQHVPVENVKALVDAVIKHSPKFHIG